MLFKRRGATAAHILHQPIRRENYTTWTCNKAPDWLLVLCCWFYCGKACLIFKLLFSRTLEEPCRCACFQTITPYIWTGRKCHLPTPYMLLYCIPVVLNLFKSRHLNCCYLRPPTINHQLTLYNWISYNDLTDPMTEVLTLYRKITHMTEVLRLDYKLDLFTARGCAVVTVCSLPTAS